MGIIWQHIDVHRHRQTQTVTVHWSVLKHSAAHGLQATQQLTEISYIFSYIFFSLATVLVNFHYFVIGLVIVYYVKFSVIVN